VIAVTVVVRQLGRRSRSDDAPIVLDAEGWVRCVEASGTLDLRVDWRGDLPSIMQIRRAEGEHSYDVTWCTFSDGFGPEVTSKTVRKTRAELVDMLHKTLGEDGTSVRRWPSQ